MLRFVDFFLGMLFKKVVEDLKIGWRIEVEIFDVCIIYFSDIVGFIFIFGGSIFI